MAQSLFQFNQLYLNTPTIFEQS